VKRFIANSRFPISNLKPYVVLLVVALMQASCLSRRRTIPPGQQLLPAQSMGRAELLRRLEDRSKAIRTLTASAALDASHGGIDRGEITEYHPFTGTIVVERPARIRVIVQVPVVGITGADMVSNGLQFQLYIPREDKWIVGDSNAPGTESNPLYNLRPKHILDALFIDVVGYLKNPNVVSLVKEAIQGQRTYYILEFVNTADALIAEELWIDRTDLEVARKIVYGKNGKVESTIEFSDYRMEGDVLFPRSINLQRPAEHYALKMTFEKTTLNEQLPDGAFALEHPSGVREIQHAPAQSYSHE